MRCAWLPELPSVLEMLPLLCLAGSLHRQQLLTYICFGCVLFAVLKRWSKMLHLKYLGMCKGEVGSQELKASGILEVLHFVMRR